MNKRVLIPLIALIAVAVITVGIILSLGLLRGAPGSDYPPEEGWKSFNKSFDGHLELSAAYALEGNDYSDYAYVDRLHSDRVTNGEGHFEFGGAGYVVEITVAGVTMETKSVMTLESDGSISESTVSFFLDGQSYSASDIKNATLKIVDYVGYFRIVPHTNSAPERVELSCTEAKCDKMKCNVCDYETVSYYTNYVLPHNIGNDGICTECGGSLKDGIIGFGLSDISIVHGENEQLGKTVTVKAKLKYARGVLNHLSAKTGNNNIAVVESVSKVDVEGNYEIVIRAISKGETDLYVTVGSYLGKRTERYKLEVK